MEDLVDLFRRQVSLYGVARFVPLLAGNPGLNASNFDENIDFESESIDIVSDSELEDRDSEDDEFDSDKSAIESDNYNEDDSDDESLRDNFYGVRNDQVMLRIHDPPVFGSIHCPPCDSIEVTMYGVCDCCDFGMDVCAKEDDFQFFSIISFEGEMTAASDSVDFPDGISSNLLRKRLYKKLFHATDFGILEKKERRRLPNCAVAKVRQIYPSITGYYMGFKEN